MFRSQRMKFLELVVLERDVDRVLEYLEIGRAHV